MIAHKFDLLYNLKSTLMIRNCLSGIIKRASSRGSLLALSKYPITELKDELQFTQGFYDVPSALI